ncbi:MAG: stalk domain-containing protein [Aminipila sp.]
MKNFLISFMIVILILMMPGWGCKASATTTTDSKTLGEKNTAATSSENQGITFRSDSYMMDFPESQIEAIVYTFPDGTKTFNTYGNAKTVVMINGTFAPDIEVKIIDKVLMVPIKNICDKLEIKANLTEKNNITIENKDKHLMVTFKVNDSVALVNNERITMESSPQLVDNTIYVPWMSIYDKLNITTKYYNPTRSHLFSLNSLITIDQEPNQPYMSKDEAFKYLKDNLNIASNHFKENYKKLYNPDNNRLNSMEKELKKNISNVKFVSSISKYYIFTGHNYTMFVDKYNKDVYFNTPAIASRTIKKIKFDDPTLFEYGYMVD